MLDPDFDPGGLVSRSCSEPRVPTEGTRSRTSALRRKAIAGKVKVAGAWVHAAELLKPAASRPNSKNTNSPKKKGGGNRPPKGQNDPLRTFNRYGSLKEDTGMEVGVSQTSLPSSLSVKNLFSQVMADIVQWTVQSAWSQGKYRRVKAFM